MSSPSRPEELIGATAFAYVHPEDLESVSRSFAGTLKTSGLLPPIQFRLRAADGSWRHTEVIRNNQLDDPSIRGVVIGLRDVTELQRVEEELHTLQREYEELIDSVDAIIWKGEAQTLQFTFVSPQAEAILGYPVERWTEEPSFWADHIHPEDREWAISFCTRAIADKRNHTFEYRMIAADGRVVCLRDVVNVAVEGGVPTQLFGVMVDITERKEAEERLREAEERYRTLVEQIPAVVYLQEPGEPSRTTYISPQMERILGYSLEEILGDPELWAKALHPDDRERVLAEDRRTNETGEPFRMEYRQITKDGGVVWLRDEAVLVRDEEGTPLYWHGVMLDITERVRAEEALRESEQRFRSSFRDAAIGMALVGTDGRWLQVNRALCTMLGYSEEVLLEKTFQDITHPDDLDADLEYVRRMLAGEIQTYQMEKRYFHKDGHVVWILLSVSLVHGDEGTPLYFISQIQNITERRRMEEQLRHQALHDPLTDLPNRILFVDRLGQALIRTRRKSGLRVGVLFMDLDGFKVINDSLGHEVGDKLLVAVGERLKGCLRPEDTLTRFGGDEFTVLIEEVENAEDALRIAERFVEELRQPFFLEGRELFVRASIGVALGDARTKRPEDLVRDADTAMYQAKEQGVHYLVFDPLMYERALGRLELENDLRRAIKAEEFVLHYQPIVNLQTGKAWGIETLVRWNHPERGLLDPSEFIPVAEETGLVIPVGEQILEEACRRLGEWQEEHPRMPPLVMCVNLSARQLQRPDLATTVEEVLAKSGVEAQCLSLDVTETVYIKALEGNTATLDDLKRVGVRISIDDFGVGYSSLSYLKRLPADTLKIDRSFIRGLGEDIEDTAIVRMIVELAHTLGMEVVAEGVETEHQATQLKEMGCDMAQGFYLAEPLSPEAVPRFLAR